jgi:glucose-1-phosphate thymidylyltransferase
MGEEQVGVIVVEDGDSRRTGRPAALELVANRPIAHHVLDALEAAGVAEVCVLSSSALAARVRVCLGTERTASGLPVRYIEQDAPLDLRCALRLAASAVGRAPCVLHSASGLLSESLAPFTGLFHHETPDVTLFVHQTRSRDGRLSPASRELLHLAEFDPEREGLGLAGVWLFAPGALERVSEVVVHRGTDADLNSAAEIIAAAGGDLQVRFAEAWSRYTGGADELLELNRVALDRLRPAATHTRTNGNRIEGRVSIHEQAAVHSSVIVGPVVIGPGARVADAYIGPYTSVGAGARIEGAEIERSIISPGASVMHIGGRLVASVVGRDARIFRDFSLPRALRLQVGDGTEVGLC